SRHNAQSAAPAIDQAARADCGRTAVPLKNASRRTLTPPTPHSMLARNARGNGCPPPARCSLVSMLASFCRDIGGARCVTLKPSLPKVHRIDERPGTDTITAATIGNDANLCTLFSAY